MNKIKNIKKIFKKELYRNKKLQNNKYIARLLNNKYMYCYYYSYYIAIIALILLLLLPYCYYCYYIDTSIITTIFTINSYKK